MSAAAAAGTGSAETAEQLAKAKAWDGVLSSLRLLPGPRAAVQAAPKDSRLLSFIHCPTHDFAAQSLLRLSAYAGSRRNSSDYGSRSSSPPAIVAAASQTVGSTESATNRTEPSAMPWATPPRCRLRGGRQP